MAAKSPHVELDLFGLHNSLAQARLDRRHSFRGISKINPEIVKNVIASSNTKYVAPSSSSLPASPPQLPVFHAHHPLSGPSSLEKPGGENAPFTIFYNGSVSVFDLPKEKAEYIMKLAMENNISIDNDENIVDHSSFSCEAADKMLGPLNNDGDMPIKRKKSLQRFFEKRKERLISVPDASMDNVVPGLNHPKN